MPPSPLPIHTQSDEEIHLVCSLLPYLSLLMHIQRVCVYMLTCINIYLYILINIYYTELIFFFFTEIELFYRHL